MKLTTKAIGKVQVIRIGGRLVLGETGPLRDAVKKFLNDGQKRILLDIKGVPYMDSAGIGELAACTKRAKDNAAEIKLLKSKEGQFALSVEFVLGLTYPGRIFQDEKAALGSF